MSGYLRLFRLLWTLKRVEHTLNRVWQVMNGMQRQLTIIRALSSQYGLPCPGLALVTTSLHRCSNAVCNAVCNQYHSPLCLQGALCQGMLAARLSLCQGTNSVMFRMAFSAVWQRNHKAGHLAGVEQVWLELRYCHCLRNEMAHFCTDLQTYIMFEVLETAWDIFMRQLQVASTLCCPHSEGMLIMCLCAPVAQMVLVAYRQWHLLGIGASHFSISGQGSSTHAMGPHRYISGILCCT